MCTVLIIDDSAMTRLFQSKMLRQLIEGVEFLEANSGEAAVELARAHTGPIDLAIVDYNMPGMNGLECAAELRSLYPSAFLTLVTANKQDALTKRALAQGVAVTHKPMSQGKAEAILEQAGIKE